jgi:putative ABC transport system permease protein
VAFAVAWRILTHQKGRTGLAIAGIFVAILLMFVELGFFIAVPQGGMLIYDHMRFDLLVASQKYVFQGESGQFPRAQLDQVRQNAQVAEATALYIGGGKWQDAAGGPRVDISVIGFDPRSGVFAVSDIESRRDELDKPDTVLVDSQTRSIFGPLEAGRVVLLDGHRFTIGGTYVLGTGFLGLGVALASEANFFRMFPNRPPDAVNLGFIQLKPGSDPAEVARALRTVLPAETQVMTRDELAAHEVAFWTTKTGTGLIFGSGLIVAFIVGIMILYQTLATQITRQLPQFAMLKAIGHTNRTLDRIVLLQALLVMLIAFVPALLVALCAYSVIRAQTLLPVTMSPTELGGVFVVAVFMSTISAMLSLVRLRRADPADIF